MKRLFSSFLLILLAVVVAPTLLAASFEEVKKSAQGGGPADQFKLAQMYEAGKDVKRDFAKAAEWYRKAAQQAILAILRFWGHNTLRFWGHNT